MSVLDMFASALGAFIMVAVILFPFYNQRQLLNKTTAEIEKTTTDLQQVARQILEDQDTSRRQQAELRQAAPTRAALDQCQRNSAACRAALTKTFLVIVIEWQERCDIDLFVTDVSRRHEFSYRKKN